MPNNCCTFSSKFCTTSGVSVIGRLTLENGVLSTSYYNLDGSQHLANDISFPSCIPITNFLDTTLEFVSVGCSSNEDQLRCRVTFSDVSALKDGTGISLSLSNTNNSPIVSTSVGSPSGAFSIDAVGNVAIIDASLITSSIEFALYYENIGCASSNTYNGVVDSVLEMKSGWGNGTHTSDSIIKT